MESTAQFWKPILGALQRYSKPICQKREGAGRMSGTIASGASTVESGGGSAKKDFRDAERFVKLLVSQELTLSVWNRDQPVFATMHGQPYWRLSFAANRNSGLESSHEPSSRSKSTPHAQPGSKHL